MKLSANAIGTIYYTTDGTRPTKKSPQFMNTIFLEAGENVVSPYNVTIADNTIVLDSNDMAIGIGVISADPKEGSKDFVISNNDVTVTSTKGGMGIGVYSADVEITDNKLTITANAEAENHAYIDYYLGSISTGIFVNNAENNTNVTIKNNY